MTNMYRFFFTDIYQVPFLKSKIIINITKNTYINNHIYTIYSEH